MALVPANSGDEPAGSSSSFTLESIGSLLDSQRDLFHSQVEQLQRIVCTQCKVTGVNPLSQEMAAGTLSIKIGKRPRDLLNPKAVSYMQSMFSIKDMIGKKETREISAYCGLTLTQVRDFFAGQRSRVRKFIRVSREKAARTVPTTPTVECSISPSHAINGDLSVAEQGADSSTVDNCPSTTLDSTKASNLPPETVTHYDPMKLMNAEESNSCSLDEKINPDDNKFLEHIFKLMRKEEKFSGQMKLMEWILQMNNSAILYWFLSKGGITILAEWLSQAVAEEQTTVILFIFKVLCHLPLRKALPLHMSSILQTVNKLRFYRKSDISNKARFLLSGWSKLFVKGHVKRPPIQTIDKKQDDPLHSKVDTEENNLLHCEEASANIRQSESKQVLKLLPSPDDNSSRKQKHIISPPKNKVRRKVLLMEDSELLNTCKGSQSHKAQATSNSRPLSVDDIQKAKMRAAFMNKSAKTNMVNDEKSSQNPIAKKAAFDFPGKDPMPLHMALKSREVDVRRPGIVKTANSVQYEPLNKYNSTVSLLPVPEKVENVKLPWKKPPAIRINSSWVVRAGENSKEVEVQTARNKREKEILYFSTEEIPHNPKEPWDREMDFDDSLTPEIPVEQTPDNARQCASDPVPGKCSYLTEHVDKAKGPPPSRTMASLAQDVAATPDLELLAVLLKNPDLVFALTSGQTNGFTDSDRFALLDALKTYGSGLDGTLGALRASFQENQQSNASFQSGPSKTNGCVRDTGNSLLPYHPLRSSDTQPSCVAGFPVPSTATASVCGPQSAALPSTFLGQVPDTARSTAELMVQSVEANPVYHRHTSQVSDEGNPYRHPAPSHSQSQLTYYSTNHLLEVCDSKQTHDHYNPRNVSHMYPPPIASTSRQEWPFVPVPSHVPFDMPMATHMRGSPPQNCEMWNNGMSHIDSHEHAAYLRANQNGCISYSRDSIRPVYDVPEFEDWSPGRSPPMRHSEQHRFEKAGWRSRFHRPRPGNPRHRSYNSRHGRR